MPDDTTTTGAQSAPATGPAPSSGPLLSYDVPQEVTYSGQNLIDLQVPLSFFRAQATADQGGAA